MLKKKTLKMSRLVSPDLLLSFKSTQSLSEMYFLRKPTQLLINKYMDTSSKIFQLA